MDAGQATVTVYPLDLASLREQVLAQGYKVEPVPGLGDEAFWSEEAGLYVGKGNKRQSIWSGSAAPRPRTPNSAQSTSPRRPWRGCRKREAER